MRIYIPILIMLIFANCTKQPSACFNTNFNSMGYDSYPKVGEEIDFDNCSEEATAYLWDLGDGETSEKEAPSHTYEEAGFYTIICEASTKSQTSTATAFLNVVSLNGEWTGYIELNGTSLPIEMELEQDKNDVDGEFVFADNTGKTDIEDGEIDENSIEFELRIRYHDGSIVNIDFEGEINDAFTGITGECEVDNAGATLTGTWALVKEKEKSATISYSALSNNQNIAQNLIKEIKKSQSDENN